MAASLARRLIVYAGVPIVALASALVLLDRAYPLDLSRLSVVGTEVVDRDGRTVALLPAAGGVWRFGVRADEVSPVLISTLVATEDRRFWVHPGVDPVALARAAFQDLRAGRIVSGGSTLTMQVARLLEPRPRTWRSKVIEIGRALQLEAHYSKRDILGMWLTLAPYGGNLEGVRAGSMAWFGVPPRSLEPAQAALLVAIPRRPEALRPDRHPDRARALRDRILAALGGTADRADVPSRRVALPRHAAPIVSALAASLPSPDIPGGVGQPIATTLDVALQGALERLVAERLAALPPSASMAVVIADARTREIRAIVSGDGSARGRPGGALDLTRAIRSPGSAMKPFIYAMAFADGLIGPSTRLEDVPRRFGGYAPENFDRLFNGPVTAAEALRRSLNLPAVALMDRIGPLRFAATLRAAGVTLRLPRGADPSLPLALGGAGISLRQATGLYASLATNGDAQPLRLVEPSLQARRGDGPPAARLDETAAEPAADTVTGPPAVSGAAQPDRGMPAPPSPPAAGKRFLPARAAATVASVLTQPFPDGGPTGVAWKTGTSWGGRDAWAFGFDARMVVGVWVGRPDGTPLPGATGRELALPVLSAAMTLLPAAPRPAPPSFLAKPDPIRPGSAARADALRLLFPPDAAVLAVDEGPVVLRAMGGRRPLTFLVDGAPLSAAPARREAAWTPPGPGFYRVTILDADGASVRAAVRVR